ncbi:dihydrofolate reductase [Sphingobium sp. H39-3-25]|uniref:dihydrofolate reductase n=1 Tax=Sphingobium arseniciresistens TaxID=3030834 RepID=UPI0023B99204|nr:dihydrofolate reductase [Sphingobium arseniciresistens]
MNRPEIVLMLARADNGVIGRDGKLPWHLPADLRRFKMLTQGRPMVMGRKTFESLPGLLDGRRHIVLTHDADWQDEGAEVVHDVEGAIRVANAPVISVIGGAEIFRLFADRADRVELTQVHGDVVGDVTVPPFDPAIWEDVAREDHAAENGRPAYSFVTLRRRM